VPSMLAKTTDGGKTWSIKEIVTLDKNQQTIGNQIVINPKTGQLFNFFNFIEVVDGEEFIYLAFVTSTDHGNTWSPMKKITQQFLVLDYLDINIRTGQQILEPAIDPQTGNLYIVWEDSRFSDNQFNEIAIAVSKDNGNTWSEPMKVNKHSKLCFSPTVKVNSSGVVGVTYYQLLENNPRSSFPVKYFFRFSEDEATSFHKNEIAITEEFNMLNALYVEGFFLGDYQSLFTIKNDFHPFFIKASNCKSSETDLFTTRINIKEFK